MNTHAPRGTAPVPVSSDSALRREAARDVPPHRERAASIALAVSAMALLAACQHAGVGEGALETPATATAPATPEGNAEFTWQTGANASSGDIQAVLPDGKRFEGTFLQVTGTVDVNSLAPYYGAWGPGWGAGAAWYAGAPDGFITTYSGKAVAHLSSVDGTKMRCTFVLVKPESGMAGGASGDCQLSDDETIFDATLRELPPGSVE